MGEAKKKKQLWEQVAGAYADNSIDIIDLHWLPPIAATNSVRMRELIGDDRIPDTKQVILQAFRAVVGARTFHVGFCIGDETGFSAIGIAVIERLMMEVPDTALYVVQVVHGDIAWDIVLRHLRNFTGQALLFAFPDSDIYDAGTAEKHYSRAIRLFDHEGNQVERLSASQRREIRERAAIVQNRPLPKIYAVPDGWQDIPWIFRMVTPAGKMVRTAVWNGRRDYAHDFPAAEIVRWVGGEKIAIVQVDSPVGANLRSSLNLTHYLAKDFDGVIHWARDTETFHSILQSFIRLDLESVSPPSLPKNWKPQVTILAANSAAQPPR